MPDSLHVMGLSRDELRAEVTQLGMPAYRADQIRHWLFAKRGADWTAMTNLSAADRTRLAERLYLSFGRVVNHLQARDGVHKLLLAWPDHATSEAVMIPSHRDGRRTACISVQVGCPVGCRFCASGIGGLARNLTAGEMVEQVWQLGRVTLPADERLSHVVFMGVGEPLANYEAVVKAVRLINAPDGFDIGARKITISTVGLPAGIRRLAGEGLQVNLAISLHAPDQGLRAELVPWAKRFPLADVLQAARDYFDKTGREITLEYVLLAGVNNSLQQADRLADMARSLRCSINLIAFNPVEELGFEKPDAAMVNAFRDRLASRGVNVHIRASRGLTIEAACGQLRRRFGEATT